MIVNNDQDTRQQQNNGVIESVVDGFSVRISFSETDSVEIPSLIGGILRTAYLRCYVQ